jgi:hypothetical protein
LCKCKVRLCKRYALFFFFFFFFFQQCKQYMFYFVLKLWDMVKNN